MLTVLHRRPAKRRKKYDFDEDDIEESDDGDDGSSVAEPAAQISDEEPTEEDRGTDAESKERLGRGARGRAKVCIC